jgi:hypothetical protein
MTLRWQCKNNRPGLCKLDVQLGLLTGQIKYSESLWPSDWTNCAVACGGCISLSVKCTQPYAWAFLSKAQLHQIEIEEESGKWVIPAQYWTRPIASLLQKQSNTENRVFELTSSSSLVLFKRVVLAKHRCKITVIRRGNVESAAWFYSCRYGVMKFLLSCRARTQSDTKSSHANYQNHHEWSHESLILLKHKFICY